MYFKKYNKLYFNFFILFVNIYLSESLYEDQVGTFDWREQFIGNAHLVHYVHSGSNVQRIVVATEQNVLAVINSKDGSLAWRHVFETSQEGRIDDMKVIAQNIIITQAGGMKIRCFGLLTGYMMWETSALYANVKHPSALQVLPALPGFIIVSTQSTLLMLNLENGNITWTNSLYHGEVTSSRTFITQYEDDIYAISIKTSPSIITLHAFDKEGVQLFNKDVSAPWITNANLRYCGLSTGHHIACVDIKTNILWSLDLLNADTFSSFLAEDIDWDQNYSRLLSMDGSTNSELDLLAFRSQSYHVIIFSFSNSQVKIWKDLKEVSAIQMMIYSGEMVLATLSRNSFQTIELNVLSFSTGLSIEGTKHNIKFPSHHGLPMRFYGSISKNPDQSKRALSFNILILSQDDSIVSLQKSGTYKWTREEALANILSVEMLDLPVSKIMAKMEDEFASSQSNVFEMFMRRVTSQLSQIQTSLIVLRDWIKYSTTSHSASHHDLGMRHIFEVEEHDEDEDTNSENVDDLESEESYLTRDEFNLHKIIVATTKLGKIFGLDSSTGNIIWRMLLPNVESFEVMNKNVMPLFVQRTSSHYPNLPICTVVVKKKITGHTVVYSFDPITGSLIDLNKSTNEHFKTNANAATIAGKNYNWKLKNVVMLQQFDLHFLHPLLLLDQNNEIHVYPSELKSLVEGVLPLIYMFTADVNKSLIIGYSLYQHKDKKISTNQLWTVDLSKNAQVITNIISKRPTEQVHSIGVVLEDRSVLYKYINPNLVTIITEGEDSMQKEAQQNGIFHVYLLDIVTGNIIFHCIHNKAKGPIHVVHSENWITYNYWNEKHRRMELSVLELYEGVEQYNSTAFSSMHPPFQPQVMRQAYIFPGHITSMAVTITEKGLTSKEILFALSNGMVMGLPKLLIDPRRLEIVSPEAREEGMIPYMPELPKPSDRVINYHESLFNIKNIHSSPSGLESTSLIFCYGLDVFFTRVTPSKMFDVLKEDFDYFFISSVLLGMIIVSLVSQKLAASKLLNRAWK